MTSYVCLFVFLFVFIILVRVENVDKPVEHPAHLAENYEKIITESVTSYYF